jgi:hypothetical protein
MKTSDPAAYSHIEAITSAPGSSTVLQYRGLFINCTTNGSVAITGSTWEKVEGTTGTYKTVTFTVSMLANTNTVLPLSLRTINALTLTNCTLFGMR